MLISGAHLLELDHIGMERAQTKVKHLSVDPPHCFGTPLNELDSNLRHRAMMISAAGYLALRAWQKGSSSCTCSWVSVILSSHNKPCRPLAQILDMAVLMVPPSRG